MQAFADTLYRWMALIDHGELEAGPVFATSSRAL